MSEKYANCIKEYCETSGVEIPVGFYRHPASRYVVINFEVTPPKLIAKTWYKQVDLVYYLQNLASARSIKILDFKERQELSFENNTTLKREQSF